MRYIICIMSAVVVLLGGSCTREDNQTKAIRLAVEGDDLAKATIEQMIKDNPKIQIPGSDRDGSHSDLEYSLQIVEPDSDMNYSILRVEPDQDAGYNIMIYDPETQRLPTDIDPKTLEAIQKELNIRKEKIKNK